MALARLIVFATNYWRGDYDSDQVNIPPSLRPPKKHASKPMKEAWNEHEEAVRIANAILAYNGIHPLRPLEKLTGEEGVHIGWRTDEGGRGKEDQVDYSIPWYDAGSDYIEIPRFPSF